MVSGDRRPIFLVGCSRSGTTLLQSMLAAHPLIASFPESKFFIHLIPRYEAKRLKFGVASRQLKPELEAFFRKIDRPEIIKEIPFIPLLMGQYTRWFIKILNRLAKEQGKLFWVEKTPDHLLYLDYIERFVPGSRIVHLVRNGKDVVASLYELMKKYPKIWSGLDDIDGCIDVWQRAISTSRNYVHNPNHIVVRYEKLVENPQAILEEICQFIGVEFDPRMLQDYGVAVKPLVWERETWKASVSGEIEDRNSQKFYRLFDEVQQQHILERVANVDLEELVCCMQGKQDSG